MRIASRTFAIDARTNSARSYTFVMCRPAGSARASSATACSTPASISRMLAPTCCETLMLAASRPLPVMRPVRSGDPGTPAATSWTRRTPSGRTDDRRLADRRDRRPQPGCQHQLLHAARRSTARPAQAGCPPSAAPPHRARSARRRAAAPDRSTTSISRRVARRDLDLAGASHARQPRAHDVEARSRTDRRPGTEPVRFRMYIGNAAGVSRSTTRSVPAGSSLPRVVDLPLHLLQGDDHVG